jgi:prepilin-type N-terminal cleavage/methylation domain-containing protein
MRQRNSIESGKPGAYCHSREGGTAQQGEANPVRKRAYKMWIPAYAGMTIRVHPGFPKNLWSNYYSGHVIFIQNCHPELVDSDIGFIKTAVADTNTQNCHPELVDSDIGFIKTTVADTNTQNCHPELVQSHIISAETLAVMNDIKNCHPELVEGSHSNRVPWFDWLTMTKCSILSVNRQQSLPINENTHPGNVAPCQPATHTRRTQRGYTLLETLVAMSILLIVLVPLMSRMVTARNMRFAADTVTAACLLRQEAEQIRFAPQSYQPVKKRTIEGVTWTITTEASGAPLVCYQLRATNGTYSKGALTLYHYVNGENR